MTRVATKPVAKPMATLMATTPANVDDGFARPDRGADGLERDREQDEPGAVVEEALAVDQRGQRRRDPAA